jgi:hypothetical protein
MPLDLEDLKALMKLYARRGIADWNRVKGPSKQMAFFATKNRIAEKEPEANRIINAYLKGGADERTMFIPMPTVNHTGIFHCFFLPFAEDGRMKFDLLLVVGPGHTLGFRFEPADQPDRAHGYGHVQMNRSMLGGTLEVKGIPQWVPDSYPAFPIRSSEPLPMFLSMATSVHGYETGMKEILRQLSPNASTAEKYLSALEAAVI